MKRLGCIISVLFVLFNTDVINGNENWWSIYFTSPGRKNSENPENGLVHAIGMARKSFYGAFYDIASSAVVKALVKAKKSGIDIKLVTERDNFDKSGITDLIRAGIPIVSDGRSGLMHHKFAIIDSRILWTGSYNITNNGSARNNNNAIKINSPELAEIYHDEFREMFTYGIFGNRKELGPFTQFRKKYYVKISNTNINAYFSPEDNIERIILKRLKKAKKTIHFMAFSFTSDKIGEVMIQKFKEGVKVYGLFEKRGAKSRYSEYIKMKIEGIPVNYDNNRYAMHHKVIIIDGERVITGSYNFSKGANKRNDENVLIIDNNKIAEEYLKEFKRLYP